MNRIYSLLFVLIAVLPAGAQRTLSLADCRNLALENNKQIKISQLQTDVAKNIHQAAKTRYLPRVDGLGGYTHLSKEISLLNGGQKTALSNLGTTATGSLTEQMSGILTNLVSQGMLSADAASQLGQQIGQMSPAMAQAGNNIGTSIVDAFRSNTRNVYAGSIMVTQPVYMGGAIKAANKIAEIGEDLAANDVEARRQNVLYTVDNAYWLVVSLRNKQRTAEDYLSLAKQLDSDVGKMVAEGVATKADKLRVDVSVNTTEMTISQLKSAVSVAKMALCELCGLPIKSDIMLVDEGENGIKTKYDITEASDTAYYGRPELSMLQNTVDMSRQATKLVRSAFLPHIALTGGFTEMNPNLFDGFHEKFSGVWNIGVVLQVPIWNWGEGKYKVRASKAATSIAELQYADARNKIHLQVEQSKFQMHDAETRLETARKNMESAEENLRCANIGFKEGVMTVTDVMNAQTAWQTAESQKTDAEISVKIAQAAYQKAIGRF